MEFISIVVDWVLRITGLGSIIIILINLCIKDCEYLENVRIIANPTPEELNRCKIYTEYSDNDNAVETTLFMPVSCKVKYLKLRSVKIKNSGKIKKGKVIKKFKIWNLIVRFYLILPVVVHFHCTYLNGR